MPEMKAMEFTQAEPSAGNTPVPQPKAGEILIQVYATGVTPTEELKERDIEWFT